MKNMARRSIFRQNEISFSSFLKAWYKELAEKRKTMERPYIEAVMIPGIDELATLKRKTRPATDSMTPARCE
jgi:hypothetical protein